MAKGRKDIRFEYNYHDLYRSFSTHAIQMKHECTHGCCSSFQMKEPLSSYLYRSYKSSLQAATPQRAPSEPRREAHGNQYPLDTHKLIQTPIKYSNLRQGLGTLISHYHMQERSRKQHSPSQYLCTDSTVHSLPTTDKL